MRTSPRWTLPVVFGLLAGAAAAFGPRVPQEPQAQLHAVAGPVAYLEIDGGGNIGVFNGASGLFVVDTHLARTRELLLAAIDDQAAGKPVRYLLNTHWHGDHSGNNEPFGERGVSIVAHEAVRARLAGDAGVEGNKGSNTPAAALPTLTYTEGIRLHLDGEDITIRHFGPGHTDGDSVVFFDTSKVVHMGDLMFEGRFPFIDSGSGGTPAGYAAAVEAVIDLIGDDWKVIPGHGSQTDRQGLREFHGMLADCIERVREGLAAGKSVEQMQKEELLGDYAELSWQFITAKRFIADLTAGIQAEGR